MPIRLLALFFFCGLAPAFAQDASPQPGRSIVYSAHDPAAIKDYRTDPAAVRVMVDRLLLAVTGQSDRARAWRSLVSPNDKIGIKISAAGGELFTTHRDVVNAIVDGLVAAGHSRGSIIVWDRSLGGMKDAGYRPGTEGYRGKVDRAARWLRPEGDLHRAAPWEINLGRPRLSDRSRHPSDHFRSGTNQRRQPFRANRFQRGHENHQRPGDERQLNQWLGGLFV